MNKSQISNSKSQISSNDQNSNIQTNMFWSFGNWNLGIIWNLMLGIWNFKIFIFFLLFILNSKHAFCDTVYLKDGSQLKGIVVEEYSDRVVLSTVDGETQILNKDIAEVQYDEAYQNLAALGKQYEQKGNFLKASQMYMRALKIKPDAEDIKNSLTYVNTRLLRQVDIEMKQEIEKKERIFKIAGRKIPQQLTSQKQPPDKKVIIWNSLGLDLAEQTNGVIVKNVRYGSSAWAEGVKTGDLIVAAWGRLTGYLSLQEVMDLLAKSAFAEVKLTIQRQIDLKLPYLLEKISSIEYPGFKLEIKQAGLTIKEVSGDSIAQHAGLKAGDLIFAINNKPTRYMVLKDAIKLINVDGDSGLSLTIRRQLTLWRR